MTNSLKTKKDLKSVLKGAILIYRNLSTASSTTNKFKDSECKF